MNGVSTSSPVVNLVTLDLNGVDSCYCHIGGIVRRVKDFFEESDRTTDTRVIRELENSLFKTVTKESIEFCDSRGLTSVLADCLRKARELFSREVNLSADLDYFRDDQGENTAHVVIRVEVNSDQQTALRDYDRMVCWVSENLPPSKSVCFTITVRRV